MHSGFRQFLSPGCINLKKICAHNQEEVLRIPKHPQLAKFGWFWAELLQFIENKSFPKFVWYLIFKSSFCTTLFLAVFLAETHPNFAIWGCFGILKISSSWWAQRFWKLMQRCLRKLKLKLAPKTQTHFFAILSICKWGLAASTSIFSGISALIFKNSVPIMKRRSWGFRNTPNLQSLDKFWLRKQPKTKWSLKSNIKPIFGFFYFLETAITWLKIIQILHVGGVLESSGPPLDDGHRNFLNWCILGWKIEENQSAILNESNCILS